MPIDEFLVNNLVKITNGEHREAGAVAEIDAVDEVSGTVTVHFTRPNGAVVQGLVLGFNDVGSVNDPVVNTFDEEGGDSMSESEQGGQEENQQGAAETPNETPAEGEKTPGDDASGNVSEGEAGENAQVQ